MKKLVLFVWIIFSFLPMEAEILSNIISPGTRDLLVIRVEFQEDNTDLTTGNGKFMIDEWIGHDTTYVLDPLPHNRAYFSSHLKFINNYWDAASNGRINVNTDNSNILPLGEEAYTLSQPMRYYTDPDSLDYRLAELVYEAVSMAIDSGDYNSNNDGVIIYHAGAGQDFRIDLDNSPFDIPSFFFDSEYLEEFLPLEKSQDLLDANCFQGVVLPESQNQLNVNIALNGTEILLTGMMLGLPTLYDTEFGRSGAGIYGLMDQGSNACSGLCPIKPSAFERYLLGAVEVWEVTVSSVVSIWRDQVYKIPISSNEYFLVEYRENAGLWADSLMWASDDVDDYLDVFRVMDSLGYIDYTFENGVLTDISDLDISLPTNGVLIWHIVEPESFGDNPNAQDDWFLNLVEADGGDDIGKWYGTLDPTVNNGWKWDMWFDNNPAYKDNNPASIRMHFNDQTHPNTRSKSGVSTGISISYISIHGNYAGMRLDYESPSTFNYDGMVFDELTTAFDDVLPGKQLLGYKDSSLYLFDGHELNEIYQQDSAYAKGKVALLSYDNSLIQITNSETVADVSLLVNTGGLIALSEDISTHIQHPIDLQHVAIYGDTLFLPPLSPEFPYADTDFPELHEAFIVDIPSWTFSKYIDTEFTLIPFLHPYYNTVSSIAGLDFSAIVNPDYDQFSYHVYSQDNGFYYNLGNYTIDPYPKYAEEFIIRSIIPIHMNDDDQYEVLSLAEINGENTLAAFTRTGELLNNFPIYRNYSKLRVYYLNNEPKILAYDPRGVIDIYSRSAELLESIPAPVNATTLFIEQVEADTAWIVSDGSIIEIPSDFVYWGYDGKDAAYTNSVYLEKTNIPVVSDKLIKNGLVYNYPNPIEGNRTKFRFFATGATRVAINIFAMDGRFITKLEQNILDQQWNEVPWFIGDLQSGVYVAKVEISDGINTETYFIKPAILK